MNIQRTPNILDMGHGVTAYQWPAFLYLHRDLDEAQPINATIPPGENTLMVAVLFEGKALHKHFHIGADDDGTLYTFAAATVLSDVNEPQKVLAGVRENGLIVVDGAKYRVRKAPNDNITLEAV